MAARNPNSNGGAPPLVDLDFNNPRPNAIQADEAQPPLAALPEAEKPEYQSWADVMKHRMPDGPQIRVVAMAHGTHAAALRDAQWRTDAQLALCDDDRLYVRFLQDGNDQNPELIHRFPAGSMIVIDWQYPHSETTLTYYFNRTPLFRYGFGVKPKSEMPGRWSENGWFFSVDDQRWLTMLPAWRMMKVQKGTAAMKMKSITVDFKQQKQGVFGDVYIATMILDSPPGGRVSCNAGDPVLLEGGINRKICVKRFSPPKSDYESHDRFALFRGVNMIKTFESPYLVKMFGCYHHDFSYGYSSQIKDNSAQRSFERSDKAITLINEYVPGPDGSGFAVSLEEYLYDTKRGATAGTQANGWTRVGVPPPMELQTSWALCLAKALHYLHVEVDVTPWLTTDTREDPSQRPSFPVHRDVKSSKVLIMFGPNGQPTGDAKLAGFGLWRMRPSSGTYSNACSAAGRYAAPEIDEVRYLDLSATDMEVRRVLEPKLDIYALMSTIWEMVNATPPWSKNHMRMSDVLRAISVAPESDQFVSCEECRTRAQVCGAEKDVRYSRYTPFLPESRPPLKGNPIATSPFLELVKAGWAHNPLRRPNIRAVLDEVTKIHRTVHHLDDIVPPAAVQQHSVAIAPVRARRAARPAVARVVGAQAAAAQPGVQLQAPPADVAMDDEDDADDDKDDGDECVICMDRPKQAVFVPCGHQATCDPCGKKMTGKPCPMCRATINMCVKVFKA